MTPTVPPTDRQVSFDVPFDEIAKGYEPAWLSQFGADQPPITRTTSGGYYIRVKRPNPFEERGLPADRRFAHFTTDPDGVILSAPSPRLVGFRITGLPEAQAAQWEQKR